MIVGITSSANSGYSGIVYDEGNYTSFSGVSYPEGKYYDKYSFGLDRTQISRSKLGDGLKEVYKTEEYGWYEDFLIIANAGYSWLDRGGSADYGQTLNGGIFSARNYYGDIYEAVSTRFILIP